MAARSVLVVFTKPVEGQDKEFNDWYSNVHLPEVIALDGFVAARRYRYAPAHEGETIPNLPFLAIYEIEPGRQDVARAVLAAALKSSAFAVSEGREPILTTSDSLHRDRMVAWFEEIAEVSTG